MARGRTVCETAATKGMGSLVAAIWFSNADSTVREIVDRLAFAQNGLYSLMVVVFFRTADSTENEIVDRQVFAQNGVG